MRVDIHPVYRVYIHLNKFCNVDLVSRGYYQLRLVPKTAAEYSSLEIKLADRATAPITSTLLPAAISSGAGVTKTIEILYAEEIADLGDAFFVELQFLPDSDFKSSRKLLLDLELWYMERDRPPQMSLFTLQSRRTLEIELNPSRLNATSRVIHFESMVPSSVHFTVFSSIVTILTRRKKPPPDPPLSQRLLEIHDEVCSALISTADSVEHFANANSHQIGTPVHFARSRSVADMATLVGRMENSERPWATLEASLAQLSTYLDLIVDQLIDMYGRCPVIAGALLKDFLDQRQKALGEGFFFSEKPLSAISDSAISTFIDMNKVVAKSLYLHKMPHPAVFCSATDAPIENCPIIFEECFGATGPSTSARSSNSPKAVDGSGNREVVKAKKRPKSFRLLNFRRKSNEGNVNNRMTKRASVDSAVPPPQIKIIESSPPLSERLSRLSGEKENGSSSPKPIKPTSSTKSLPAGPIEVNLAPDPSRTNLRLAFVKEREVMKARLQTKFEYEGNLYSELAYHSVRPQCFALSDVGRKYTADIHLVVLVHGLEGNKEDLLPYRNVLKAMGNPRSFDFLMSETNANATWADFETMSKNLLSEIRDRISFSQREPKRISFIAHSMGGIIVRGALGLPDADFLFDKLHTFMTINTPHLGVSYAARPIQIGMNLIRWWKQSQSIDQLSLRDGVSVQNAYLVRVAQNKSFGRFRNVILVGSPPDVIVPSHSSLIEPCRNSTRDPSALGTAFRDMLTNIYDDLTSADRPRTVIRYSTFHNHTPARSARLTGRAAHIAPIEDDIFIEKLFSISALRYFTE